MRHDNINGAILGTTSAIKVSAIELRLSAQDAYALCNLLTTGALNKFGPVYLEADQAAALLKIGRDLGVLVDHHSRNNLGDLQIQYKPKSETPAG